MLLTLVFLLLGGKGGSLISATHIQQLPVLGHVVLLRLRLHDWPCTCMRSYCCLAWPLTWFNELKPYLTSYARFLSAQPPLPCPYLPPLLQTGMPYGIRDGSLGWLNQNYYRGTHHLLAPFFLVWRCPPSSRG